MARITRNTVAQLLAAIVPFVGLAGSAGSAEAYSREDQAYASSVYDYCDAKKVASVWGVGVGQAKAIIGGKILAGRQRLVDADIDSTAGRVRCTTADLGLSYRDAVKLANYWGRSPGSAKAKAESIATQYGGGKFRIMMAHVIGYGR